MIAAFLLAAGLGFVAADFPEPEPCSDDGARHVTSNYRVCAWHPPPPVSAYQGGSDYDYGVRPFGGPERAPLSSTWLLRSGDLLRLDEVPATLLHEEKTLVRTHYEACRTPAAQARLGEEVAELRAERAYRCWEFLHNTEVRREGEPRILDHYDQEAR